LEAGAVPADYGELFEGYFDYVKFLVEKSGIQVQESEDVAQELLIKFMEPWRTCGKCGQRWNERQLARIDLPFDTKKRCQVKIKDERGGYVMYDPKIRGHRLEVKRCGGVLSSPNGGFLSVYDTSKSPKFTGLLRKFVLMYVRQNKDKQHLRMSREAFSLDLTKANGEPLLQVFMPDEAGARGIHVVSDQFSGVEFEVLVQQIAVVMESFPEPTADTWGRDEVYKLFARCVEIVADNGTVNQAELAKELGVSRPRLTDMLGYLRTNLAAAGIHMGLLA
jgi:hypothetical protein